jgi:hypothetical protein
MVFEKFPKVNIFLASFHGIWVWGRKETTGLKNKQLPIAFFFGFS